MSFAYTHFFGNTNSVVILKKGKIKGKVCKNYYGDEFYSFFGIPYAKPPIGTFRFKVSSCTFLKGMINCKYFKCF